MEPQTHVLQPARPRSAVDRRPEAPTSTPALAVRAVDSRLVPETKLATRGGSMKVQSMAVALAGINLVLLLCLVVRGRPVTAETVPSILRAQTIELVDDRGRARASLEVEDDGQTVFRLRDANGTIRVKLGASEDGSGLVLLDDGTEPGIHLLAKGASPSLTLKARDGTERRITP
jgi:hypothetical protein